VKSNLKGGACTIDTQILQIVQHEYHVAGEPTQKVIAELLDVSVSTVSRELSGVQPIDIHRAAKYCKVLGFLIGCEHPAVRNREDKRFQRCLDLAQTAGARAEAPHEKRPTC
jgi:transcriptional regulator with XRE-family HTH domain